MKTLLVAAFDLFQKPLIVCLMGFIFQTHTAYVCTAFQHPTVEPLMS